MLSWKAEIIVNGLYYYLTLLNPVSKFLINEADKVTEKCYGLLFFLGLKNMRPGVHILLKWIPYFMDMRKSI